MIPLKKPGNTPKSHLGNFFLEKKREIFQEAHMIVQIK